MLASYSGVGERHDLQRPGRLQQAAAVRAQRNAEGGQGGESIILKGDRYLLWKWKFNALRHVFDKSCKSSHFQELSEDAEVLADAYGEILKNAHLKVLFDILSQESRLKVLSNSKTEIVRLTVWSSDGKWTKNIFQWARNTQLRIHLKLNTALLSTVRPRVRVSQAWHLTFLTYIKA